MSALVVWFMAREWLIFYQAETGRTNQGVEVERTPWWRFVLYYIYLALVLWGGVGSMLFHLSDVVMLIGLVALIVVLIVVMTVRALNLPKAPRLPTFGFAASSELLCLDHGGD